MPENKIKNESRELSFEEMISRLEQIAGQLEDSNVSLEQSLALYEEGARLAALCSTSLKTAQQKITEISALAGGESQ